MGTYCGFETGGVMLPKPYYEHEGIRLFNCDCLPVMKEMPDNSVDSCVTDPPYGLRFMGKKWDYDVPSVDVWSEVYRVMKPGAFLLSFGGTRTYHRMVVNIEDAGFEIRDQIQWLYGSGFPKSLDISKAIDKGKGKEREVVGIREDFKKKKASEVRRGTDNQRNYNERHDPGRGGFCDPSEVGNITAPATPEAIQWDGWGTALKPANEPICLARKPLSEKTVAANVLKWGTGGLNIDGCRVEYQKDDRLRHNEPSSEKEYGKHGNGFLQQINAKIGGTNLGRFPADVIHDGSDEVVGLFPDTKSGGSGKSNENKKGIWGNANRVGHEEILPNSGSAARFFYVAKASKAERGEGNTHPTVKPLKLMCYLCRLVTPPGGTVLDCYVGSGTTGVAAQIEGFDFIGIDKDIRIATRRIEDTDPLFQAVRL